MLTYGAWMHHRTLDTYTPTPYGLAMSLRACATCLAYRRSMLGSPSCLVRVKVLVRVRVRVKVKVRVRVRVFVSHKAHP